MRLCPQWFQDELTRIGGTNNYGEPIFKLVWSPTERTIVGGRWNTGFEGYREVPAIPGHPCWALIVWEPRELTGHPELWDYESLDMETGLSQIGGYPKYGHYRLLRKFFHQEIVRKAEYKLQLIGRHLETVEVQKQELISYRMEPCGLMLDLMLPMLMRWRRLSDAAKIEAIKQDEQLAKDEFCKRVKDARAGCTIRRGSQLVAKRAEVIEKGFMQAMQVAAKTGLGMRIGD
jgi:hypothetical protein